MITHNERISTDKSKMISLLLISFLLWPAAAFSQKAISGIILDPNENPLTGVTICQGKTRNCVLSDPDGAFQLTLDKINDNTLNFSFVGYKTINIGCIDTINSKLKIQMIEDTVFLGYPNENFKIDPSFKGWGFTAAFTKVDMIDVRFDEYLSILGLDNVILLNGLGASWTFELTPTFNRYQAGLMYGFNSVDNNDLDSLILEANSNLFGLSLGYKIIDNFRFVVTPLCEVKWYKYRLTNSDIDRRISLNQYMTDRDLDIRFNQTAAFFGASIAYKIYDNLFSSEYWTIGFFGGYIIKLNDQPWIYSTRNRLIDNNKIKLGNLNFGLTFSLVID